MLWLAVAFLGFQTEPARSCAAAFAQGDHDQVLASCGVSADPAAQLFVARSNVILKRFDSAIAAYNKVLAVRTGDVNTAQELADAYMANGQASKAAALLASIQVETPRFYRRRVLANRAAAFDVEKSVPSGAAAKHGLLGLFRFEAGLYREAFYHYRRALAVAPDFPTAHAAISEIYHRVGHPDWAETEVQLEKNRPPQGEHKLALDFWQAAQAAEFQLGQFPVSWEKLDLQARAAKLKRVYGEAADLYRQALVLSPGNDILERELALCLYLDGKYPEAEPMLLKRRLWLELTKARIEMGKMSAALTSLTKAEKWTEDVEVTKLYGTILIELGRAEDALPMLQANAGKDVDGSLHTVIGKAYQALHRANPAGLALVRGRELRKKNMPELDAEITPPE